MEQLEELFTEVQVKRILRDQKTFADSKPLAPPQIILEEYRLRKKNKNFELKKFVESYFEMPEEIASGFVSNTAQPVEEHINILWDVLTRQSQVMNGTTLIPLPKKFVVPGGRFREIYYWDSYFTILGLQAAQRLDLIESMVENFSVLITRFWIYSKRQPQLFF